MKQKRSVEEIWYDSNYYNKTEKAVPQWYRMLYPRIKGIVNNNSKILEVGCGKSYVLKKLAKEKLVDPKKIYGIEQSDVAIHYMKKYIRGGNFVSADANILPYKNNVFDFVLLLEVIEHLEKPNKVLSEISRVVKKRGTLFLSFPNFSFFPWRIARFFSDVFKLPQLINKQPIDAIYTINEVIEMVESVGFGCKSITGVTYLTAGLSSIESIREYALTKAFNRLGGSRFSLHPLFEFVKL